MNQYIFLLHQHQKMPAHIDAYHDIGSGDNQQLCWGILQPVIID